MKTCELVVLRVLVSMGHARNQSKLLPDKLVLIREHLGIDPMDLTSKLEVARKLEVTSRRLSNYETGKSEPTLMELLVYARLVNVRMELIIDDEVSVDEFRERLGKQKRRTEDSGRIYNEH